jgi:thioredoxin-like negative regulator of GroEL
VVAAIIAGVAYAVSSGRLESPTSALFGEPVTIGAVAPVAQDLSLPLPRRGEIALARARTLAAGGRLHEALATLDGVRPTDAQKDEADRLRADVQRQLLAFTAMPASPAERRLP